MGKIKQLFSKRKQNILPEWVEFKKIYNDKTIFICRKCELTGQEQVKADGPSGDGEWHNVKTAFKYSWEKEWYKKSKVVKENKNEIKPIKRKAG